MIPDVRDNCYKFCGYTRWLFGDGQLASCFELIREVWYLLGQSERHCLHKKHQSHMEGHDEVEDGP